MVVMRAIEISTLILSFIILIVSVAKYFFIKFYFKTFAFFWDDKFSRLGVDCGSIHAEVVGRLHHGKLCGSHTCKRNKRNIIERVVSQLVRKVIDKFSFICFCAPASVSAGQEGM